jgi:hypothetical protein
VWSVIITAQVTGLIICTHQITTHKREKKMKHEVGMKEVLGSTSKVIHLVKTFVCLFVQLHTAAFKAYCAILVRHSNFRYQASPRM